MTIEDKIKRYCENSEVVKSLKKECNSDKADIKAYLAEHKDYKPNSSKYSVKVSEVVNESVDEDRVIDILKRYWSSKGIRIKCPWIKTQEVIDMEALEKAVYANEIPQEVLLDIDKCRVKTVTTKLTYKIAKEK